MLALVLPELLDLRRMAGETGIRDIPGERNVHWRVRVVMTREAAREFVVCLSRMTVATPGNGFLHGRRMTYMTALTSHGLVLSA